MNDEICIMWSWVLLRMFIVYSWFVHRCIMILHPGYALPLVYPKCASPQRDEPYPAHTSTGRTRYLSIVSALHGGEPTVETEGHKSARRVIQTSRDVLSVDE